MLTAGLHACAHLVVVRSATRSLLIVHHIDLTPLRSRRLCRAPVCACMPPLACPAKGCAALQVTVQGHRWDRGTVDICIAGLGWVTLGLQGEAELTIWRHQGIAVTTRDALLPKYAEDFEKPGWSSNCKGLEQWRTGSGSVRSHEGKKDGKAQGAQKQRAGKQGHARQRRLAPAAGAPDRHSAGSKLPHSRSRPVAATSLGSAGSVAAGR